MKLAAHDVVVVVGVRGAGKSYWVGRHVVKRAARRVVVWDPHGEHRTVERCTLDELAADPGRLDREALSLAVVPKWRTLSELAEQFEVFADLCASMEGVTIVIDEVGLLKRAAESIEYVACQSRHWDCPLVLVAQRAVQVPKTAREQMSHLVSFRQSSPDDIAALVERCGESAARVRTLPRRDHWAWSEDDTFENSESEADEEEKGDQK